MADYYTASMGETLVVPYDAGVMQNDVFCGNSFSIDVVADPAHGTLTVDPNGSFEYTPNISAPDTDTFTYSLKENNVEVDQATVTIWVISDDCTVVAFADGFSTAYETLLDVPGPGFVANDILDCPLYEPLLFGIQTGPANGTLVDDGDGGFEYQPDPGFSGLDTFVYNIRGGAQSLLMAKGVVSIHVSGAVCAAADDSYTATVDQTLTIPAPGVLGNDTLCEDFHLISVDQQPGHGQVTLHPGGDFDYVPDPGYVGPDTFTYQLQADLDQYSEVLTAATVSIDVAGGEATTTTTIADSTTTTLSGTTTTTLPGTTTTTLSGTTTTTLAGTTTTEGAGPTTTTAADVTTTAGADTTTTEAGSGSTSPGSPTSVPDDGPIESIPSEEQWAALPPPPGGFRVATFNASLSRAAEGDLLADLSTPDDPQAAGVAEVLQRTRPDIVLLNEFDYVEGGAAVEAFRTNYLAVAHNGAEPIDYPYFYIAPTNTGVESGFDLDNDGAVGGPGDALGFGDFEGQYGMVVLSQFPIVAEGVRTFQNLLWTSMPGARLPDDSATPEPADFYSPEELAVVRLSSTSHWDVPVYIDGRVIHVLAAHPTAPDLDGAEDRNGRRNADEIKFWADYVAGPAAAWIVDDAGVSGGLDIDAEFVVVGDMSTDPVDGDAALGAADQLLTISRIQDPAPRSEGAVEAAEAQGGANQTQAGDPALDTADFDDDAVGNQRVDYALPSNGFDVLAADVFWPRESDELSRLVTSDPLASSDHRLVWIDLI